MYEIREKEKYTLRATEGFDTTLEVKESKDGIVLIRISARAKNESAPFSFTLSWMHDDIDISASWTPNGCFEKIIPPDWGRFSESFISGGSPILSNLSYDDKNRLTVCCSDTKNLVGIRCGVHEETAELECTVRVNVEYLVEKYEAYIRLDTRDIPFYDAISDASYWLESYEKEKTVKIPEAATLPFYSTWYSFHHNFNASGLLAECRYFKELGCDALIIDGGWYKENNTRGLGWTGDWKAAKNKLGDMRTFVNDLHSLGMKCVIWYAVGFVGIHSDAYSAWADKRMDTTLLDASPLDPRYPAVREHLIDVWTKAVSEWGIDGFKLDFIDGIRQSSDLKPEMDIVSIYDAIERLMEDALTALRRINPDILIEFRQPYTGSFMRRFGNMLRATDCPNDSLTNRLNTLSLRLYCGKTPVHSDMVMWNYNEPAELAALQLTNTLFAVPQISVLHEKMPEDHKKMVTQYLRFWKAHRKTLLEGTMFYQGYVSNFSYVSSRLADEQIGALYSGQIVTLSEPANRVTVINASKNKKLLLTGLCGNYSVCIRDCLGNTVFSGTLHAEKTEDFIPITAPVSAYIELNKNI